jgi:glycerophosphoryl diester phosphodiesterase
MKKPVVLILLALGLVACVPSLSSPKNPFITDKVWVIAHQGGEGIWPSNTMYAFERAVKMGVDMLDLDVNMTQDGVLVVVHDDSVDRTTDGKGKIKNLTLEQIQALDAGWYWPQESRPTDPHPFRGQGIRIPTLEAVFKAFPQMPMTIEIKQDEPSLAKPFCEMLRRYDMTDKVIIPSFIERAILDFRAACPEVMTAMTESEVRNLIFLGDLVGRAPQAKALQVPTTAGPIQVVTPGFVSFATARGLVVQPWTINDATEMRALIGMGVHGINTDRPDVLMKVLGRAK